MMPTAIRNDDGAAPVEQDGLKERVVAPVRVFVACAGSDDVTWSAGGASRHCPGILMGRAVARTAWFRRRIEDPERYNGDASDLNMPKMACDRFGLVVPNYFRQQENRRVMDRQIVYPGAVPLDSDHLLQNRNTMVAIGYLAKAVIGDDRIIVDGFDCGPGNGLTVVMSPGTVFAPSVIDANSYGALPPDEDPLLKAGTATGTTTLGVRAGVTTIISVSMTEVSQGDEVVAYYNPAQPDQSLFGPIGNGAAQATVITQRPSFTVSDPDTVPSGAVRLWVVTVPSGAASVTADMISVADGAPFIRTKLPATAPIDTPAFIGRPTAPTPVSSDDSTSIATTAFVKTVTVRNRAAWGTAGTFNWDCPAGVTNVLARMWAAGGHGGPAGSGNAGGGGGGGGYIEVLLTTSPGQNYTIRVGSSGGVRTSALDSLASVSGGADGGPGTNAGPGAGGGAGTVSASAFNFVAAIGVTAGSQGFSLAGTVAGGAGGGSFGVAPVSPSLSGLVSPGAWPGGGGAGGNSGPGGAGADGLVILEWLG
ncbi:MAG: hypothetical protein INR71_00015 [Terriglobus roseus]|nr:hypothetical protein [Terriglobus roseus]